MRRHAKHGLRLRSLFLWHRYLGLLAAPWVLILAVTGFALNHTDRLSLAYRHVAAESVLRWYGIQAPPPPVSYAVAGHWVTQVGDRLYLDRNPLSGAGRLVGAVAVGELIAVGLPDEILLLTPRGERVERLDRAAGVPAGIEAVGITQGGALAVRAAGGIYAADANFLTWARAAAATWTASQPAPAPLMRDVLHAYRDAGLTWERLLLDMHSGRLFGRWGVYVMDGAAGLLLLLVCTGLWHWTRRKR